MNRIASTKDLEERIASAVLAKNTPPLLESVQKNVHAIMTGWPSENGLYLQLKRLASFIEQTKAEIAALRPDEVKHAFLPKATDELDAIVAATAEATTRIMDSGDVLMELVGKLSTEESERGMAAVMSIFEACSFQDITGQRITKVINTLKVIEARVDHMIESVGAVEPVPVSDPSLTSGTAAATQSDVDHLLGWDHVPRDADLLNGPALPGQGKSQEEIDALLGF